MKGLKNINAIMLSDTQMKNLKGGDFGGGPGGGSAGACPTCPIVGFESEICNTNNARLVCHCAHEVEGEFQSADC